MSMYYDDCKKGQHPCTGRRLEVMSWKTMLFLFLFLFLLLLLLLLLLLPLYQVL